MLDVHGAPKKVTWTTLAQTLTKGSNIVKLSQPVDWKANDRITITTTTYSQSQSELFDIDSISSDNLTLTLKQNASYNHLVYNETLSNGQEYKIAAAVGLISHNVKFIGQEYPEQVKDEFGFRILVSGYFYFPNASSYFYYQGKIFLSFNIFTL